MSAVSRDELEGNLEICKEKLFMLCAYFNLLNNRLSKARSKPEEVELEEDIRDIIERRKKYEKVARELEYLLKSSSDTIEVETC